MKVSKTHPSRALTVLGLGDTFEWLFNSEAHVMKKILMSLAVVVSALCTTAALAQPVVDSPAKDPGQPTEVKPAEPVKDICDRTDDHLAKCGLTQDWRDGAKEACAEAKTEGPSAIREMEDLLSLDCPTLKAELGLGFVAEYVGPDSLVEKGTPFAEACPKLVKRLNECDEAESAKALDSCCGGQGGSAQIDPKILDEFLKGDCPELELEESE